VLVFERATADETIIVALNFGSAERSFGIRSSRRWRTLFDTHDPAASERPQVAGGGELTLRPRQSMIIVGV
jgi:hypothetical protein